MHEITGRLRAFLSASARERQIKLRGSVHRYGGKLRFHLVPSLTGFAYASYRPDSEFVFGLYPEFRELLPKWIAGNKVNNAGDLPRLYGLVMNLKQIISENVPGDFAELGVYKGNSAAVLAHFGRQSGRNTYLFDTFSGFNESDLLGVDAERKVEFTDTSLRRVKDFVGTDNVTYIPGYFPDTITDQIRKARYAFVNIDLDLYQPVRDALSFFYERLSAGGMLMIHDYSSGAWGGAKQAVDEFWARIPERIVLLPDKSGTAILRRALP